MAEYQYVSSDEVRRVCTELGLRDWTAPDAGKVDAAEAEILRDLVGGEAAHIPLEDFMQGLSVELEHGTEFPDANVTQNHPVLTARIVLAHLKEGLDYYARLEIMELEMDLDVAIAAGNPGRTAKKRRDLAAARARLEDAIARHSA
jgi:hypothetical protein